MPPSTPDAGALARSRWPELVDRACELLGEDPFAGAPHSTRFAQPAIFLASMAAWREEGPPLAEVCAMAGHSLGELSALAAAGALAVDDALRLVVLRARLMADAAAEHPGGGMVALLGADPDQAVALAGRHRLAVANDNAPGQIVVSGSRAALGRLVAEARAGGVKALELDVSGAFHSPHMASAELPFLLALEDTPSSRPAVPVVSGCTAQPFSDLPIELSRAIVSPVRWRETMGTLVALGAKDFVDIGPGRVLARLVKRNVGLQEARADVVAA
jgi:malonyl CoA-acyl carrier protein transacylase